MVKVVCFVGFEGTFFQNARVKDGSGNPFL